MVRRGAAMKIPESTKRSLHLTLIERQRERWPGLQDVKLRYRGSFAYVDGILPDGEALPLCRLRYGGDAAFFGFAIYRASHDDYEDSVLPDGSFDATPDKALDCACALYLDDPAGWPTN
jgi:hypothetical protein